MNDIIKTCRNIITGVVATALLGAVLVSVGYGMTLLVDNYPFTVTWIETIIHSNDLHPSPGLVFWGKVRFGLFTLFLYLLFGLMILCFGALLSQFGEFIFEIYSERKGRHHAS